MTLYRDFASHYDAVFPTDAETVDFLARAFPAGPLLDLGCATGGYALALAAMRFRVEGVDLDPRMIAIAREKAAAAGLPATFTVSDIAALTAQNAYGGIFCVGNTLVHLSSKAAIAAMIMKMHSALKPGGMAVVQIVDYDRILDKNIERLPTLSGAGRRFERDYRKAGGKLLFHTALTYEDERYEADTPLVPLRAAELARAFEAAGFAGIEVYGDFDGSPFNPQESFALIMKGEKKQ